MEGNGESKFAALNLKLMLTGNLRMFATDFPPQFFSRLRPTCVVNNWDHQSMNSVLFSFHFLANPFVATPSQLQSKGIHFQIYILVPITLDIFLAKDLCLIIEQGKNNWNLLFFILKGEVRIIPVHKKNLRKVVSECFAVMTRMITMEEAHVYVPTNECHANQP